MQYSEDLKILKTLQLRKPIFPSACPDAQMPES